MRNINGKISKRIEGIFKKVKNIGIVIETLRSLKKLISSKIFKINARDKKTKKVFNNVEVKILLK
tara:strand:- start:1041 stop:1235 length:195 start_codon:yes stop_codon:yes gene_type:complete